MIDPKELMLDNCVWSQSRICYVTKLGTGLVELYHTALGLIISDGSELTPIRITGELLHKLGFEISDHVTTIIRYRKNGIKIDKKANGIWRAKSNPGNFVAECKYLHELQNIYKLFTGEELEWK